MGSFTTGIGLFSGFDSASLIEQILLGESRGRLRLQGQIASLQTRQASMLEINARLLGLQSAITSLGSSTSFGAMMASSSDVDVLSATASTGALAGDWTFIVESLATRHQSLFAGAPSQDVALGLDSFSIEFGGGVRTDAMLSDLNGGAGIDRGRLEVTIGSGADAQTSIVDCTDCTTIRDVIERLEAVDASLRVDIDDASLRLRTTDGRAIAVADMDGAGTAADLGLLADGSTGTLQGDPIATIGRGTPLDTLNDGTGVLIREGTPDIRMRLADGRVFDVDLPDDASTVGDILDAINSAVDLDGVSNDGALVARIASDGMRIELVDSTGSGSLSVTSTSGNASAAADLGIMGTSDGSTLSGSRILAGLESVLRANLNGGSGVADGQMLVTDASGTQTAFTLDDSIETLSQIVDHFNAQADAAGTALRFELNQAGNGLRIVDGASGDGAVSTSGALGVSLGLDGDTSGSILEGRNLQHRYVDESMSLSALNGGQGVGLGSFTIRDATGMVAEVEVGSNIQTVTDLIDLIESRGLAISARINDRGDGLLLESTAAESESSVSIRVQSDVGTTAVDLRLEGESSSSFGPDAIIDGGWEHVFDVDASTTLSQLRDMITDSGIEVSASLLNIGDGDDAWRLSLSSNRMGAGGRFTTDARTTGGDFVLSETLVSGGDARVVLGDDSTQGVVLTSSSNTIVNAIDGLSIHLHEVSASPVTVSVSRDAGSARDAVLGFVEAYNQVADLLRSVDSYDVETGTRGVLLGDPTVARVSRAMSSMVLKRLDDSEVIEGFQGLWEIGIGVGSGGRLEIDEERLAEVLASDPDAVEALFNRNEGTQRGYAVRFDELLGSFTDENGAIGIADERFKDQIELASSRIGRIDLRLEARRMVLVERFAAMERALATLQSQNAALLSFQSSSI